jgi:hypothetical protein
VRQVTCRLPQDLYPVQECIFSIVYTLPFDVTKWHFHWEDEVPFLPRLSAVENKLILSLLMFTHAVGARRFQGFVHLQILTYPLWIQPRHTQTVDKMRFQTFTERQRKQKDTKRRI